MQPTKIKVGLKHTYYARFGSTCIMTLTPLRHNLLRTLMTLCSKHILANPQHVLHHLLPSRTQHSYKLRLHRHDCFLTVKSDAEAENSPLCDRQHGIRQANPRFADRIIRSCLKTCISLHKLILLSYCTLLRFVNFSLKI